MKSTESCPDYKIYDMNFSTWWEQNKSVYEKIGVEKEVAHTIWCAAVDTLTIVLEERLLKK